MHSPPRSLRISTKIVSPLDRCAETRKAPSAGILGNFAPWTMGRVTDLLKQSAHAAPAYIPAYATLGLLTFVSTVGVHLIHRLKHSSAVEVVAEERSR